MWLVVAQFPKKAEWRDAPLALHDFSQSNKQKLSVNIAISFTYILPILPILSRGVKLIFSSQLFPSSDAKVYLLIALQGSISNGFSVFICLIFSSLMFEGLLDKKKYFEQFLSISLLINVVSLFNTFAEYLFCTYFFYIIFSFARDDVKYNDVFR